MRLYAFIVNEKLSNEPETDSFLAGRKKEGRTNQISSITLRAL